MCNCSFAISFIYLTSKFGQRFDRNEEKSIPVVHTVTNLIQNTSLLFQLKEETERILHFVQQCCTKSGKLLAKWLRVPLSVIANLSLLSLAE